MRIARPLPLVRGDKQRNWQVLTNLISNALKFSPSDTPVEIAAFKVGPAVHVEVRDHGAGIERGDSSKLFEKFARLGNGDAPADRGTGLGLYLTKRMVESQGGRIWLRTRQGEGSTFIYKLPLAATSVTGNGR
jgi:signal transduction histidine kinase